MLAGPFYVCWLDDSTDSEILERYSKYGSDAFNRSGWSSECDTCATRSCSINTGFAGEMKKFFIDLEESKVVHD